MIDDIDIPNIATLNKRSKLLSRINRIQFISLFSISISALLAALYLFDNPAAGDIPIVTLLMFGTFMIVILLLKVKRLHDINLEGWMALLTVIPIIGLIIVFLIFFVPGTVGNNKYGAEPSKAGLCHRIYLSLMIVAAIVYVAGSYFGFWVKFEKWNEYHSKYYSIQLPGTYTIKNYEIFGIPAEEIYLDKDRAIFNVGRLDFKGSKDKDKNYFIRSVGLEGSLESAFNISAYKLVDILLPKLKSYHLEIISDNTQMSSSVDSRHIKAKLSVDGGVLYLKLSVYLDTESDEFYLIYAIYDHESKLFGDSNAVDYYFNSFKLVN